jgi:ATP-dependent helicase/nuclease subunit A
VKKIASFLERFSRWRTLARQVSLSQCLEEILAETLYADWLRAQPCGAQRAGNVSAFLQLAQQFDQFQRQGLFRFLKFIEAQQAAEVEPEVPAIATENAVRLMSIHQSKGLEFPVVVLADLAKQFNESDLRGDIIFDEEFGLCPKIKPPMAGGRYPSLPHWLAQRRQKRELRGEELRLLYVALTRAREYLFLTASVTEKNWEEKWLKPQPVTVQAIAGARSFADWLALWFGMRRAECGMRNETEGALPELGWQVMTDAELADGLSATAGVQASACSPDRLKPELQPTAVDLAPLKQRLEWQYSAKAAIIRKAKSSVTALRREAEELDDEAEPFFKPRRVNPKSEIRNRKLSATETGVAHHKFLQHVALDKTGDLAAEAERLTQESYLSADERAALDLLALKQFWGSPLGKDIVAHAKDVRRELPFTARFSPAEIAAIIGKPAETGLENEFIVVQGVADLVVLLPEEIWLVDFKTDEVAPSGLADKVKTYTPQLRLYAAALEKIFGRKVTRRALHFLAAGKTEEI